MKPRPRHKKKKVVRRPHSPEAMTRRTIEATSLIERIERGVPKPPQANRLRNKWAEVLEAMKPGDSLFIENKTKSKLGYVRRVAVQLGLKVDLVNEVREDLTRGVRIFREEAA